MHFYNTYTFIDGSAQWQPVQRTQDNAKFACTHRPNALGEQGIQPATLQLLVTTNHLSHSCSIWGNWAVIFTFTTLLSQRPLTFEWMKQTYGLNFNTNAQCWCCSKLWCQFIHFHSFDFAVEAKNCKKKNKCPTLCKHLVCILVYERHLISICVLTFWTLFLAVMKTYRSRFLHQSQQDDASSR